MRAGSTSALRAASRAVLPDRARHVRAKRFFVARELVEHELHEPRLHVAAFFVGHGEICIMHAQ